MKKITDRKPIFAAVRRLLGRALGADEVARIDATITRIELLRDAERAGTPHVLGSISEHYESGGRGPGTVSGGQGDPGGVSYGLFQLASRTGTVAAFLRGEGKRWASELSAAPGSPTFSAAWKAIATRDGPAFAAAQHAFIEQTHYRPAVKAVTDATGFDHSARPDGIRDAAWSSAVQHASAPKLLKAAVGEADAAQVGQRGTVAHDCALAEAIYRQRSVLVRHLAAATTGPTERKSFQNIAENRYPDELASVLAYLLPLG